MELSGYATIDVQEGKLSLLKTQMTCLQPNLANMSQGVKSRPVLQSDPREKLMDATHADINLGSFFKKLITSETARIQTWEICQDVKGCYEGC